MFIEAATICRMQSRPLSRARLPRSRVLLPLDAFTYSSQSIPGTSEAIKHYGDAVYFTLLIKHGLQRYYCLTIVEELAFICILQADHVIAVVIFIRYSVTSVRQDHLPDLVSERVALKSYQG